MTALDLKTLCGPTILERIIEHNGLATFAAEKAKFEGWLKVELTEVLKSGGKSPIPESGWTDIVFDGGALELKTVNTNYNYPNVSGKTKPITDNVDDVIKDIAKLKSRNFENSFVLFVVFPAEHNHKLWQKHYLKINNQLTEMVFDEFKFSNEVPGIIYFGKI